MTAGLRERRRRQVPVRANIRQRGFTLLETIVAFALFAAAAMAMYSLFNTNLNSLVRAQEVTRQTPVVRFAAERLSAVNPWREQAGRFRVDGYDVEWSASLVEPVRRGQNSAGLETGFDVALYEVTLTVSEGGRGIGVWRMRMAGYERVRGLPPPDALF